MKTERVVIELVVYRDDSGGATDMNEMWQKLCVALHEICGVDEVRLADRAEVLDAAEDAVAPPDASATP